MKKYGIDIGAVVVAIVGVIAAIQTDNPEWYFLALAGFLPMRRIKGLRGGGGAALLALLIGGCSGASALGPVMDPQGIFDAAGIAGQCASAESVMVAPAFDVDWSGGTVTYGGGVFVGCESDLFRFRCVQEKPTGPDEKPVWRCEPLGTWKKQ